MKTHQKALLITAGLEKTHGLDELNVALGRGWRVVHVTPLGGAGVGAQDGTPELHLAALVILERQEHREEAMAGVLEQAEEEVEELIDELSSGDGANADVEDPLGEEPAR